MNTNVPLPSRPKCCTK